MVYRSSRPQPSETPKPVLPTIAKLRWRHRLGRVQIGGRLGLPASTGLVS
ncbi:MAG: hypothetical protein LLG14_14975 [Nocardiaceae bacterium]|nr:hypothetical protein [Nocardiaceae bacterium]